MKDLQIFEDTSRNDSTSLPDFEEKPTFEGFLATDREGQSSNSDNDRTPPPRPSPAWPATSRTGRVLKPTSKVKKSKGIKKAKRQKTSFSNDLIVCLTKLLNTNWESQAYTSILSTRVTTSKGNTNTKTLATSEEDPVKILAAKLISEANAEDETQFVFSAQLDVEEPETYNWVIIGIHAPQWSQAMRGELDQLKKNNTWTLVWKDQIPSGYRPLGGKWVYKVKRNVNGNIARFKARWIVKGYLQQFRIDFN